MTTNVKSNAIRVFILSLTLLGCSQDTQPRSTDEVVAKVDTSTQRNMDLQTKPVGIEGTERPVVRQLSKYHYFYIYKEYVVHVGRSTDVDESIEVYRRTEANEEEMLRLTQSDSAWLSIVEYSNFFHGLAGDFLFVDAGTAPEPRTYFIYNLKTRSLYHTISYSSPVSLSSNHLLRYFASTNIEPTKENCPKADEWLEYFLTPEIQEEVVLNLNDLSQEGTGNRRCVAVQ